MKRFLIDSSVTLIATGGEHPARADARLLMAGVATKSVELHASTELIQEFLFHRLRIGERTSAVDQASRLMDTLLLHPFDETVGRRMIDLVSSTSLRGRDAVHAATALTHGFAQIVSADKDFDGLDILRRTSIQDAAQQLR